MFGQIVYCQGPVGALINKYVCSTKPPTAPGPHHRTWPAEYTIYIIVISALLIALIALLCYRADLHDHSWWRSRRQQRFENQQLEMQSARSYQLELRRLENERLRVSGEIVDEYDPEEDDRAPVKASSIVTGRLPNIGSNAGGSGG